MRSNHLYPDVLPHLRVDTVTSNDDISFDLKSLFCLDYDMVRLLLVMVVGLVEHDAVVDKFSIQFILAVMTWS